MRILFRALSLILFVSAVLPPIGECDGGTLAASGTVTVRPAEIGDVLYNPGMGFADFQFGAGWGIFGSILS